MEGLVNTAKAGIESLGKSVSALVSRSDEGRMEEGGQDEKKEEDGVEGDQDEEDSDVESAGTLPAGDLDTNSVTSFPRSSAFTNALKGAGNNEEENRSDVEEKEEEEEEENDDDDGDEDGSHIKGPAAVESQAMEDDEEESDLESEKDADEEQEDEKASTAAKDTATGTLAAGEDLERGVKVISSQLDSQNDDDEDDDDDQDPIARQLREFEENQKLAQGNGAAEEQDQVTSSGADAQDAVQEQEEEAHVSRVLHASGVIRMGVSSLTDGAPPQVVSAGGTDGMICMLPVTAKATDNPRAHELPGGIVSLDIHPNKKWVVCGLEQGCDVSLIKLSDGSQEKLLCRLPSAPRDTKFSPDGGRFVAIGTADNAIKIVNVENITDVRELKGHTLPVCTLAWRPTPHSGKNLLASSSKDGSVKVWDVSTGECVKTWRDAMEQDRGDTVTHWQVGKIAWSPDGKHLAIPGKNKARIVSLAEEITDWSDVNLEGDKEIDVGFDSPCNACAWSPNGKYLALSSKANGIALWDTQAEQTISYDFSLSRDDVPVVQDIAWVPRRNELVAIDVEGELFTFRGVIPAFLAGMDADVSETGDAMQVDEGKDKQDGGAAQQQDENVHFDEDDKGASNADGFVFGGDNNRAATFPQAQLDRINVALDKLDAIQITRRQRAFQPGATEMVDAEDDPRRYFAWNSVGSIVVRHAEGEGSVSIEFANSDQKPVNFTDRFGFELGALCENGAVFASVGSPSEECEPNADDEDWDPVRNEDGFLRAKEEQAVNLAELFDKAERVEHGYEKATLDDEEGKDDMQEKTDEELYGDAGVVYYRSFNSVWGRAGDWQLKLPPKEKPRCVAVARNFVAVATSRRVLRIIRTSGLQETPIMLAGPVVSMVAAASLLFVVYHKDEPSSNGTHSLAYYLLDVGSEDQAAFTGRPNSGIAKVVCAGAIPVPVRELRPLQWVGFSDASMGYMPLCIDSKGALMGLSRAMGWNWVYLCDMRALPQIKFQRGESLWPVSLQSSKLIGVVLKHGAGCPEVYPRPILTGIDLRLPLLGTHENTGAIKYQLEDLASRKVLAIEQIKWAKENSVVRRNESSVSDEVMQKEEAQLDTNLLKAFILALKLKKQARALGIVKRMRSVAAIKRALNDARKLQTEKVLMVRIERFLQAREQIEEELEQEDDDDDESETSGSESDDSSDGESRANQQSAPPNKRRCGPETAKLRRAGAEEENPSPAERPVPIIGNRKRLSAPSQEGSASAPPSEEGSNETEKQQVDDEDEEEMTFEKPPASAALNSKREAAKKAFSNPFALAGSRPGPKSKAKKRKMGPLGNFVTTAMAPKTAPVKRGKY